MGSQDSHAGSAMQRARIAAGYTDTEAAALITRDVQSIRRYESGQCLAPQAVQIKLARAYGVSVADLQDLR